MKKSTIYKLLRLSNDWNAIKKGKVFRRIGRRFSGRMSGKFLGRFFR